MEVPSHLWDTWRGAALVPDPPEARIAPQAGKRSLTPSTVRHRALPTDCTLSPCTPIRGGRVASGGCRGGFPWWLQKRLRALALPSPQSQQQSIGQSLYSISVLILPPSQGGCCEVTGCTQQSNRWALGLGRGRLPGPRACPPQLEPPDLLQFWPGHTLCSCTQGPHHTRTSTGSSQS